MPEKRMLIVPAEIVRKIDENRGDMSQGDFIEFLIDSQIGDKAKTPAETKKRPALKLKASPAQTDEQTGTRDRDLPAEVEDWWSTEAEDEQTAQVEKKEASESDQDTSSV